MLFQVEFPRVLGTKNLINLLETPAPSFLLPHHCVPTSTAPAPVPLVVRIRTRP